MRGKLARVYEPKISFRAGDLINHATFGVGICGRNQGKQNTGSLPPGREGINPWNIGYSQMDCLNQKEKQTLLCLARVTLNECFEKDPEKILKDFLSEIPFRDGSLFENLPCFVSLTTVDDRLRGCIGCTETHQRLIENVHLYTQFAAFRDPRFPEVEKSEARSLIIGISVLGPNKPLANIEDITLGKHGLIVRKGAASGLLLAKVAQEYGWDKQEFLSNTYMKAGLSTNTQNAMIYFFEEISFSEDDFLKT